MQQEDPHPTEELLLRFEDDPGRLDAGQRAGIETHLTACHVCNDSLLALRGFDSGPQGALQDTPKHASLLTRLSDWIAELFAVPIPGPALGVALFVLAALPTGVYLFYERAEEAPAEQVVVAPEVVEQPTNPVTEREPELRLADERPATPPEPRIEEPGSDIDEPGPDPKALPTQLAERPASTPRESDSVIPTPVPELEPIVIAALDPARLPVQFPAYAPPWGATGPPGRMGSVVRGDEGSGGPGIVLLAPRQLGRTSDPHPTLYYFVARRTERPLLISVTADFETEPILAQRLEPPVEVGIHAVRLAESGAALEPGVRHTWSIALEEPSTGAVGAASLARFVFVEPSQELAALLELAPREHAANIFAEHGLWYDAIFALSDFIEKWPEVAELRDHRATLLSAEGLTEPADYDRGSI